jgi:hypothetical protein
MAMKNYMEKIFHILNPPQKMALPQPVFLVKERTYLGIIEMVAGLC